MGRWQGCLLLIVFSVPAFGQEWRPASTIRNESTQGITLGKPRTASSESSVGYTAQPLPSAAAQWQTAKFPNDLDRLPEPVVNYPGMTGSTSQTSYQRPVSAAEEAFNCGQVPGQAPAGGAPPGGPAPIYGQPPGGPPPASTPWYKDCWNKIFGGGSSNNGIPGTWDARSDQQFKDFISPVTSPTLFEDPRSLTEFRVIGSYQKAPGDNSLLMGGHVFNFNLQGRISINDQWSIVLHKLAVTNISTGDGTLGGFSGGTGLDDIQIGPKWTFYRDSRSETLLAFGTRFDIPIGSHSVLAGSGWGMAPYLSYGQGFGDAWHFLANGGYRFGFGSGSSDYLFANAHIDYGFFKRFYPLAELNWYHYTGNGNRQPVDYDGGDLLNIGADNVAGKNLVTVGLGFRFKFSEGLHFGAVYEMPVVGNNMMEKYRVNLDLIFRY